MSARLIALVVGLSMSASSALSAPFSFTFDMPAFDIGGLAGQTSVLTVTVDNGNATNANQSYLNTQITAFSVTVGTLSYSGPITNASVATATYLTTDGAGRATLDLSANVDSRAQSQDAAAVVQLGTRDGSGPTEYNVNFFGSGFGAIADPSVLAVTSRPPAPIPLPAAAPLLLAGAGSLLILRRRRRAA